uniref:C3H1-type domain-containing protein n=1 Tax=Caenorhabditis japonica TaxID=281687 RepID=A0A8R1HRJ9_CAEJA
MTGSKISPNDSMHACNNKENVAFKEDFRFANLSFAKTPGYDTLNKSLAPDLHAFEKQDLIFKTLLSQTARNTLANQDPCSIPDDLREELMRQKRKDDAFKTALCDSYRRNQTCSYGENCRFAHGVHELRLPQHPRGRNHPKYKTVLCDKFSTTGTCKYGTRCQFIHKLVNPALLAQASGLLNTSTGPLNQSLFMPPVSADMSMDMNQSLPYRRNDIARAFARANRTDFANDSVNRLANVFDSQYNRIFQSEFRNCN